MAMQPGAWRVMVIVSLHGEGDHCEEALHKVCGFMILVCALEWIDLGERAR
jgi:hypothetical protein